MSVNQLLATAGVILATLLFVLIGGWWVVVRAFWKGTR